MRSEAWFLIAYLTIVSVSSCVCSLVVRGSADSHGSVTNNIRINKRADIDTDSVAIDMAVSNRMALVLFASCQKLGTSLSGFVWKPIEWVIAERPYCLGKG